MLWPWFRRSPEASFEKHIIAGLDKFHFFLSLLGSQQTQNDLQKRVKFHSGFRLKAKKTTPPTLQKNQPTQINKKLCWET